MARKVFFATGNEGKIEEMQPFFTEEDVELVQVDVDVPEIDAMDVEEVAERKVRDSFQEALEQGEVEEGDMMIVEDTGFYVESLGGFPGAEAAFFAGTAGAEKLLKLLEDEDDRSAYFKTAIAVIQDGDVNVFTGRLEGRVPEKPRGESHDHLPYNTYLVPDEREGDESLAENSMYEDERFHRTRATLKFLEWL
ncbi:MAG: non-canonical purine NTP pyrophosphatase [Candidatus Nanosalina sp.]